MIYDPANRLVHILNDTAAVIFDLCDGQHDLDAIEREVRLSFHSSEAQDVRRDILETLDRFSEIHLLC